MPPNPADQESDDRYKDVLINVGPSVRIITCPRQLQWIVQVKRGKQWMGRHFCQTREALIRCLRRTEIKVDKTYQPVQVPDRVIEVLEALPEHINRIVSNG